mmetsp:Transcript_11381/g.28273  ORF Transcript_11381/g.28273 Transcript_11381/m.28273 type:complete len:211 (+) Transcript_11381:6922-7554(+)
MVGRPDAQIWMRGEGCASMGFLTSKVMTELPPRSATTESTTCSCWATHRPMATSLADSLAPKLFIAAPPRGKCLSRHCAPVKADMVICTGQCMAALNMGTLAASVTVSVLRAPGHVVLWPMPLVVNMASLAIRMPAPWSTVASGMGHVAGARSELILMGASMGFFMLGLMAVKAKSILSPASAVVAMRTLSTPSILFHSVTADSYTMAAP